MALLNLRDVASSAGTAPPLVSGRLFRSGQPYELTEADIASIEGEVDTIIDLRDVSEVSDGEWDLMERHGAQVLHIPLAGQILTDVDAASEAEAAGSLGDDPLGVFYVSMLQHSAKPFVAVARAVLASQGALLHCAAGKDRTGVATAMMLDLIGVDEGPIVADYERTNEAMRLVIAQLASLYGGSTGAVAAGASTGQSVGPDLDVTGIPKAFLQAPADAIEMFLTSLRGLGGARGYLEAAGMGSAEVDRLASHLTTPR